MAKDRRRGGRTTPKGTRPAHLRPVGGPGDAEASPLDDLISSVARELIGQADPLAAETWASVMLDAFGGARRQARLDGMETPPFEQEVIERCRQRQDPQALAVVAGLAAVLPPPHADEARSAVAELRAQVTAAPGWLDHIGAATPTRAWIASDVFGDQDSLIVGFAQAGASREHALAVLVDHNLSGQAKDAWIAPDPDDAVAAWGSNTDPRMRIDEVGVDEALRRLRDAMAMADLWNGDTELRSRDFAQHRALIWARLRRAGLGDDEVAVTEVPEEERDALVAEFLASPQGHGLSGQLAGADVDAELLVHCLVSLRADYEGRPLRWSPAVAHHVLVDLAPRKLLLDADQAAALPAVVRAFVRFAGERRGLEERFVEETLAAVDEAESTFLELIEDPAAAGPAKAMLAALAARGVDISDPQALEDALEDAVPMQLSEPAPKPRRSTAAAPAEVVEAAERAPILARIATLTEYYGNGRKLTQTGQPTLADARALVGLLGTADRMDEKIGDKTFKTTSAAELPELSFTIRWATAAGALRKQHGKLGATASWAKLAAKPLERWTKAAGALPSLGPLAAYYAHPRYPGGDEVLDDLAQPLLSGLLARPRPFDDVLDWVCQRADEDYEWRAPIMQDPDRRRRSLARDLDRFTRILGWAGIVERVGASSEPNRFDPTRCDLVGGTLQLTPVGSWWLSTPR